MRGGFLDVAKRHAGVEGGGDERVPQGVRPYRLGDPGAAGHPAHDPRGAVPVQLPSIGCGVAIARDYLASVRGQKVTMLPLSVLVGDRAGAWTAGPPAATLIAMMTLAVWPSSGSR